jgi:transcriptional regulator with XRE-family HTH domain
LALKQRLLAGTRELRIRAGLSQLSVSGELSISPAAYGRLERGDIGDIGLVHAAEVAAVLGARLSVQLFPVGLPIRDAAQVALLDCFMRQVPRIWNPVREAPMPIVGDLRAWDLLLRGPVRIGVEAETRPGDLQAEEREIHLQQRDSGVERVILLIAGTKRNRELVRGLLPSLRVSFPLGTHETLRALRLGQDPGADGLILL